MKPWMKWTAGALLLALLAAGTVRTLVARKTKHTALEAQQITQKTEVTVALAPGDIVSVKTIDMAQGIALAGPLRAISSAVVKARVPGELLGLTVREGDAVNAGQVIARIDATESQARERQARQQVQAAKAQVDMAQRSYDNNRALVGQGFISGTALDASQATLNSALANLAAAQAGADLTSKNLDDTVLRAPISGLIAQRLAQPGERVGIDARIVEIIDISRLELEATLSAAESVLVKVGQTAQLTIEGTAQSVSAKVVRVNPNASVGSRAILVYLAIAPQGAGSPLRQGLFAQGTLATGTLRALAIPLSAVRTDKPKPYVQWVQQDRVQHQTIELGLHGQADGLTQVAVTGVTEGAQLIDGTVGTLRAGTLVKIGTTQPGKP
jgi:RND family efflux transporter MFP subunit